MRYIIDNAHPDYTNILKNLFKNKDIVVKDFSQDKDLSFLKKEDCLVLSVSSIIDNENLFFNLRQSILCYTANRLSDEMYKYYGYKKNVKGFICSSIENQTLLNSLSINNFFVPNIYPELKNIINLNFNCEKISSLINRYEFISKKFEFNDLNSYKVFEKIKANNPNLELYDQSTPVHGKDTDILINSKYCLHIKYWGHVCNAPLKALALGVPVIMDDITYRLGGYSYYIQHGFNGIIVRNHGDIIELLKNNIYNNLYNNLKINCINFRNKFIDNYSDLFYNNFENFLNE